MIRPSYRPGNVRNLDPGRVNCQTRAAAPRARCMIFFFENLRNPARNRRAGLIRQFSFGQLYSTKFSFFIYFFLGSTTPHRCLGIPRSLLTVKAGVLSSTEYKPAIVERAPAFQLRGRIRPHGSPRRVLFGGASSGCLRCARQRLPFALQLDHIRLLFDSRTPRYVS